jgi:hypothetical protein
MGKKQPKKMPSGASDDDDDVDLFHSDNSSKDSKVNASGNADTKTAVVKKRKAEPDEARAFESTMEHTYTFTGLLGIVERNRSAGPAPPKQTHEIAKGNVNVGTRIIRVTDSSGDSETNSGIIFQPDLSTLVSNPLLSVADGGGLQVVLQNIHNCSVTFLCEVGPIQLNGCEKVMVVLKRKVEAIHVQASQDVTLQFHDAYFPGNGITYRDVTNLSVSLFAKDGCLILGDRTVSSVDGVPEGSQSIIVHRNGGLDIEVVSLKAEQQQCKVEMEGDPSPAVVKRKKNAKKKKKLESTKYRIPEAESTTIPSIITIEEMEKRVAFCCFRCVCTEDRKKTIPFDNPFVQSGQNSLYHRRCCHDAILVTKDWTSPIDKAEMDAEEKFMNKHKEEETVFDRRKFKGMVDTAKSLALQFDTDESRPGKLLIMLAFC